MSDYLFLSSKRKQNLIIEYILASYHLIYLCSKAKLEKAKGNGTSKMYIVWSVGERVNF